MTVHALQQLIRHRRHAIGRHGAHSPFVYGLIDTVLLPIQHEKPLSVKTDKLVTGLEQYYHTTTGQSIHVIRQQNLPYSVPLAGHIADTIVLLSDIHSTEANTRGWQQLCMDASVTLSVDLYHVGILFFSPRFREKQHFLLRF